MKTDPVHSMCGKILACPVSLTTEHARKRERERERKTESVSERERERERERKSNLGSLPTAACTTLAYSAKQHGELSHRVSGTESKTRLHQQTGVQAPKPEYHEGLRTTQDPLGALCPGLIMH